MIKIKQKHGAKLVLFSSFSWLLARYPPGGRNIIWRLMVIRQVKKLPTVCGTLRLHTVPTRPISVPCGEPPESNCHYYKAIYKIYDDMTTAVPRYAGSRARCFVFRRCGVQTSVAFLWISLILRVKYGNNYFRVCHGRFLPLPI
jgi:hypothetical protein